MHQQEPSTGAALSKGLDLRNLYTDTQKLLHCLVGTELVLRVKPKAGFQGFGLVGFLRNLKEMNCAE